MGLDPNKPRDALIAAGRERLLTNGIDALRSQLNASVLSAVSPMSRDTAYRVFRGDPDHPNVTDAIVAAVSEAANDPSWTGYYDAIRDAVDAYQAGSRDEGDRGAARAAVIAGLAANFTAQFRSPGLPVTWLLQTAAMTASEAWEGEAPPAEDVALGRELLDHRREFYDETTGQLVRFLTVVMSDVGRRPRAGVDPATVVMLLHAIHDGAVLRNVIQPGALQPEQVGEAMYALAEVLTEAGPLTDPRRPVEDRGGLVFDRLLDAAETLWCQQAEVTVEDAAAWADLPIEAALLLFPTVGDLADSLVRSRVVGGGFAELGKLPADASVGQRLMGLTTELRSLRDFADGVPHAVAASHAHLPKRSTAFADDFVDHESRTVAALGATPDPVQLVRDLVTFASRGTPGWPAVTALLRTLGHADD